MSLNKSLALTNHLLIINFLIIISLNFFTPVWADFVKSIGGNLQTAGNAIALFSIVLGFFTWLMAKIENQLNQDRFFMIFSQLLFVIGYAGFFWVTTPLKLYLVQICLGVAGALQVPVLYALYQEHIPHNQSTWYWGLWNGLYNLALGMGAFISAFLVYHYGFKAMFSLLVTLNIIALILVIYVMQKIRRSKYRATKSN